MNLKKELSEIIKKNEENSIIYEKSKKCLNKYRTLKKERLTYNFHLLFSKDVGPKSIRSLSKEINIEGMQERAINEKLLNSRKIGFNPKLENVQITNAICSIYDVTKDKLIIDYEPKLD